MRIIRTIAIRCALVLAIAATVWGGVALAEAAHRADVRAQARATAVLPMMERSCGVNAGVVKKEYRRFMDHSHGKWDYEYMTVMCDGDRLVAIDFEKHPDTCGRVLFENSTLIKWRRNRYRFVGCGEAAHQRPLPSASITRF